LRDDVEWSFNIETEVFVEFSLLWLIWVLVSIDDIPLLVNLSMLSISNDVSALSIYSSTNIKDLSFLVGNDTIFITEEVPPS